MIVLWSAIAEDLRQQINSGKLKPGDRLPSETDLAARWDVCRMTAHRAMDELQREGLVLRKRRVGTIVLPPETRPIPKNPVARETPAPRKTRRVALLFFHVNRYPQASYLEGFRNALPDEYHLLYCDTQNSPEREEVYLRQMSQEADAICCYCTGSEETWKLLRMMDAAGTPVVCLDMYPEDRPVDAVVTDNYGSTRRALESLLQRGHRRIGFIAADRRHLSSVRERWQAYQDVMRANGVEQIATLMPPLPRVTGYRFDSYATLVEEALRGLLESDNPPTLLFCLEDWFLATTLEACDRMGIRVPADLEIVSFSDIPHIEPRIPRTVHRLVQPAHKIGAIAGGRLTRRLRGEELPVSTIRIPAQFIPAAVLSGDHGSSHFSSLSSESADYFVEGA